MTGRTAAPPARVSSGSLLFYRFVRSVVAMFARVFWRLTVEGQEHLPASGAYVVSPVHRSNIDTPLTALVSTRRLRFMGKDSLWKYGASAWFLSSLGGFPVHRGTADREALRQCIEVIRGGEPLVIFPEGTRREGAIVEELFDGAAYVATRTGVPVVPVGIGGSQRAMPRGSKLLHPVKIHMIIGEPLSPKPIEPGGHVPRRAVSELTGQLKTALQELFDQARIRAGD